MLFQIQTEVVGMPSVRMQRELLSTLKKSRKLSTGVANWQRRKVLR